MKRKCGLLFGVLLIIGLLSPTGLSGQECGPSCPVCSGGSTGKAMDRGSFFLSGMYIPGGEEETGVFKLRYGIFSWLDAGIGYTVKAEKLTWSLRVRAISEDEDGWRPGLLVGTGSVQIGGGDQSFYMLLTKSREFSEGFAVQVSGGLATLMPDFDRLYGLAGFTVTIREKYSAFINYDGRNIHPGISWVPLDWLTLSAVLIEGRDFALSAGIRWKLK